MDLLTACVRAGIWKERLDRNLEVIWLLGGLKPDHWTINEFRREHRTRFKAVFRQFNVLCGGLGLFGGELVAIDGTFLKAVNHPSRNFTRAKVEQMLKEIDERTERYLETLEQADAEAPAQSLGGAGEPEQAKVARLREQIAKLEEQRREHAEILTRLAAEPGTQLSLTDPDSRSLQKGHERVVGYNAQIAVDAAQHLIVVEEVTGGAKRQPVAGADGRGGARRTWGQEAGSGGRPWLLQHQAVAALP